MEILKMLKIRSPRSRQFDGASVVGVFDARVGDIVLEGCQVVRTVDDTMLVSLPSFVRSSRLISKTARFADQSRFHEFRELALKSFNSAKQQEPEDEGLRLGATSTWRDGETWSKPGATWSDTTCNAAEHESLALAGL